MSNKVSYLATMEKQERVQWCRRNRKITDHSDGTSMRDNNTNEVKHTAW